MVHEYYENALVGLKRLRAFHVICLRARRLPLRKLPLLPSTTEGLIELNDTVQFVQSDL
jgi:hypothetical protein